MMSRWLIYLCLVNQVAYTADDAAPTDPSVAAREARRRANAGDRSGSGRIRVMGSASGSDAVQSRPTTKFIPTKPPKVLSKSDGEMLKNLANIEALLQKLQDTQLQEIEIRNLKIELGLHRSGLQKIYLTATKNTPRGRRIAAIIESIDTVLHSGAPTDSPQ